jgi:hypothetical protein
VAVLSGDRLRRSRRPANDPPPYAGETVVRWLPPLRFSSLVAGRSATITPPLAKPTVKNDDDVGRLGERGAQLVVDVPILA